MGLILVPSEVKQKTGILKSSVSDLMESYRKALQAVLSFSNSEELKTETYEEMKTKVLEYHQLIAQGMIAVADCILEDAAVLEGSVGSEELDEDLLKENIRKLQNDQQTIRDQINSYQKKRSNPFLSGSQRIKSKIAELVAELEVIEEELQMLNLKLLTLHHISRRTETLFTSVFSTLAAVNAAICDAGVEITGTGMKADLDWEDQLTDDIAQMDEKIRQFIEETLAAELQIDLDEVIKMYGDDVVERMIDIVKENEIDRLKENSAEKVIKAVMEALTGYQVTKLDGKYRYVDKDGESKELTAGKAEEILQRQANIDQVVKVALSQNGIKEEGVNHTEYNNWYYNKDYSAAWCAIFVLWCMNEAELLDGEVLPIHKELDGEYGVYHEYEKYDGNGNCLKGAANLAVVYNLKNWYDEHDRYVNAESGYEPKAGDLMVHLKKDGSGEGHTGIVVAYDRDNQIVYTIEGNSSDQVAIRDYKYNSSYIDGYCINGGNLFGTIPEESAGETTRDR